MKTANCILHFIVYFLGIIIVSDSASVTGLPNGTYRLDSGIVVEVKNETGICVIKNTDTLAGRYTYIDTRSLFTYICLLALQ